MNKFSPAISSILLNRATFINVAINELSCVNFFYGNNGVGKSTIARVIESGKNLFWNPSRDQSNYDMLVFNANFINNNFANYDNLPGVFILGEEDAEAIQKIEKLTVEKESKTKERDRAQEQHKSVEEEIKRVTEEFQELCFAMTLNLRKNFDKALEGKKQKKSLSDAILSEKNPKEHNLTDLQQIYRVAFDDSATTYQELKSISITRDLREYCNELLSKVVISTSNTEFSKFLKAINASDWVRSGHSCFSNKTNGKCPYCQQNLPSNFEENIKACFDNQYKQDIDNLTQVQANYKTESNRILSMLKSNLNQDIPDFDLALYREKISNLERLYEINNQYISEKIKEPSKEFTLEKDESLLKELNDIIFDVNKLIQSNNQVITEKRTNRNKCKIEIIQYIAFLVAGDVKKYKETIADLNKRKELIENTEKQLTVAINSCLAEIQKLNRHNVNTKFAVEHINKIIETSGFQGFKVREKAGVNNAYEVVRNDGNIATHLSEGERNFIAFLYFYHLVRGSWNDSEFKDKIVVIDDPVSSMDSTALFLVSSLVREMISVCLNNVDYQHSRVEGNYIKQLFVLTHNVYFFREIVYGQIAKYEFISFYLVRKQDNLSTVKLCVRQSSEVPSEQENFCPVQNSYSALWTELNEVSSSVTVQNVMRRILEYYFMQLCGYCYSSFNLS